MGRQRPISGVVHAATLYAPKCLCVLSPSLSLTLTLVTLTPKP
jgi:hypothetical protein